MKVPEKQASALSFQFKEIFEDIGRANSSLVYVPEFREFGIAVLNGKGRSYQGAFNLISYCPFSGKRLPKSLRDMWFDELERLGVDPHEDSIPDEFKDERWWTSRPSK